MHVMCDPMCTGSETAYCVNVLMFRKSQGVSAHLEKHNWNSITFSHRSDLLKKLRAQSFTALFL